MNGDILGSHDVVNVNDDSSSLMKYLFLYKVRNESHNSFM